MTVMRDIFSTMGTVVSAEWTPALAPITSELTIEGEFSKWDERFSLYRPESELSRIARGELNMTEASTQLRSVYEEAVDWRIRTNGAFTPHRPDGVIDLNGIVKALAIRRAGAVFDSVGITDWCINAGGDLLFAAEPFAADLFAADLFAAESLPRIVGIVDPGNRSKLLCSVSLVAPHRAVATSGNSERGDHIWRSLAASDSTFSQVSVFADDIVTADVLATAIVSGGPETLRLVTERWPVDVIAVDQDDTILMTPAIRAQLAHDVVLTHTS